MLKDLLLKPPLSKFILIEDTFEDNSKELLNFLLDKRIKRYENVHLYAFEGAIRSKKKYTTVTDYCSDVKGWVSGKSNSPIREVIKKLSWNSSIFVIDSLVHLIFEYGHQATYKLLNDFVQNKSNIDCQIIVILHTDLLLDDIYIKQYEHLATFILSIDPKFNTANRRISYTYKKSTGKIIKGIEEFWVKDGNLETKPIEKLDPTKLLQNTTEEIVPDTLTTFKISLEENERQARDQLVLPYYPKEMGDGKQEEVGQIFYQFDANDDWDEEDPDDDLDI